MNNLVISLKRFFGNKNTITILCVIGAVLVLWFAYGYRIDQVTNPVTVPYAKETIQPRTQITEQMLGYIDIPAVMLGEYENVIRDETEIIGKYASYNTVIPAGSLFYTETLLTWAQMPDSAWADIPDGYTVVSLNVDVESTYGNSIFPGNYIDLYYQTFEETGKLVFGKLIESIEVLAVKDGTGKHVFENSEQMGDPASLIFAVPEDLHLLLRKASFLDGTIIPVPRNASYSENPGATIVSSEFIQDLILSQTVMLVEENSNSGQVGTID